MPRDFDQVFTPLSTPVLSTSQQATLLDLIEQHWPELLPIGKRIASSDDVTDRDVDTIVGFLGETNSALHGRDEGPVFRELTAIYDAISREYWGIGRRIPDFDDRFRRLDTVDAAALMDSECSEGAQVVGTVVAHEAFGMFVDVGWSALGLVLYGNFPNDPSGPRDFPDLGSRVSVQVLEAAPRGHQIYMRMIGPASS